MNPSRDAKYTRAPWKCANCNYCPLKNVGAVLQGLPCFQEITPEERGGILLTVTLPVYLIFL